MENNPFFSVIIPTYNRAQLVTKTIDSVLAQKFQSYEIIVVDNKSTDDTIEALQSYITSGLIRFYQNDENHERAFSRNRGFSLSKGEFLTLLDSDDILYPDCLETAHEYITSHPHIQVFHAKYEMVDMKGKYLKPFEFPSLEDPLKALAKGNFLANLCIFYNKKIIDVVRFDENPILIGIEDYDFLIRLVGQAGHLGRIDKVLGGLREHETRSVYLEKWDKTLMRVQYFFKKHTSKDGKMNRYSHLLKAHLDLYLCSFLAIRYHFKSAFKYALYSFTTYPAISLSAKFWRHQLVISKFLFYYLTGRKK